VALVMKEDATSINPSDTIVLVANKKITRNCKQENEYKQA
jgi:hypothetical protein